MIPKNNHIIRFLILVEFFLSLLLLQIAQAAPANDLYSNAATLEGTAVSTTGSNIDATKEIGEPDIQENGGGKSVWWKWAAPTPGTIVVNTHGSDFDTVLGVFQGSSISSLTLIASNDDDGSSFNNSGLEFNTEAGEHYFIMVDGYSGVSGSISLSIEAPPVTRTIRLSNTLAFGDLPLNSSSSKSLIIYNDGNSQLTVNSIVLPTGFSGNWAGSIPANGSQVVSVTFTPTVVGSYVGNISINANQTSGNPTVSCSGTGIAATKDIRIEGDLNFGNILIGQSSDKTITIHNDGNSSLSVSSINTPEAFQVSWTGLIAASGSQIVPVTFNPTDAISYGGTIEIISNRTSGANTINCSGKGINRIIEITGDGNFGGVDVGSSQLKTLTIANTGNSPLQISQITFPPDFSGDWTAKIIEADSSSHLQLSFTPTEVKDYSGTLEIISNKTGGDNTVSCAGTGITRIIKIIGDLEFNKVSIGQTSQRTFLIENLGNGPLNITAINYPDGFSGDWTGTISAGGSQEISVTFAPTKSQAYAGEIVISSDKLDGDSIIQCSGEGQITIVPVLLLLLD